MAEIPVLEAAAPKGDKKADKKADKAEKKPAAAEGGAAPAGGGKKKLIIFIAIGVAVLGGLGAGAWLMFGGKHEDAKDKKQTSAQKEEKEEAPKGPLQFVALDPPFVVNFEAEQARALPAGHRAGHVARPGDHRAAEGRTTPSSATTCCCCSATRTTQTISTLEGKEKLRGEALEAVRKVVTQQRRQGRERRSRLLHQLRDAVTDTPVAEQKILNQDEIDALIHGVDRGAVSTESGRAARRGALASIS